MSRKTMSARGTVVNFDLFEIKKQILTPATEAGKKRERFIDKKRRRTSRTSIDQLIAQQKQNEASVRESLAKQKLNNEAAQTAKVETPVVTENETDVVVNEVPVDPVKIIKKK